MNAAAVARQQRRWQLEQRSAELRVKLASHAQAVTPALAWADRARQGSRWLKSHPWIPLGVAVLLLLRRPRRALRWGTRAWGLWKTVQRARGLWQGIRGTWGA
ncbi:MAG TPA: YqjK family protein [Macromonas sp.]|nr:YqjK family protein [Macromonas sp.]